MDELEKLIKEPETFKEKLNDFWYDISYYYPRRIRDWWWDIKRYFRNLKKFHNILVNDNDFDHGYLEDVIYLKLEKMCDYFRTSRIIVDAEKVYYEVNLARRLAEIAFEKEEFGKPLPYVNISNAEKYNIPYFSEEKSESYNERSKKYFLEDLRKRKARNILFRLISEKGETWWD